MVDFSLATNWIEQQWTPQGRRHWQLTFTVNNFNSTSVMAYMPQFLLDQAQGKTLVIEDIALQMTCKVGMYCDYVMIYADQTIVLYLDDTWTVARKPETRSFSDLRFHCNPGLIQPGSVFFAVYPHAATYDATDDMVLIVRGYIEGAQVTETMPVSLEGYKWPLVRR